MTFLMLRSGRASDRSLPLYCPPPRPEQEQMPQTFTDPDAHADGALRARAVTVVAQLAATRGHRVSLSCNPALTLDLLDAQRQGRAKFLVVGQANSQLPFMPGDGDLAAASFDLLLEGCDFAL